jgi:hypothetical protein
MATLDFGPATRAVAAVLDGIGDDQLADPTPWGCRSPTCSST